MSRFFGFSFLTLIAVVAATGCSMGPGTSPPMSASDDADVTTVAFPQIGSCDELAQLASAFVDGIPLDEENSYIEQDVVSCLWARAEDEIDSFEQIQSFSITIEAADATVVSMDEAESLGVGDLYFTDPRLDDMGGIALWLDMDTSVTGLASGSVHVPGLDITFADARFGAQNLLDRDTMVDLAVAIIP